MQCIDHWYLFRVACKMSEQFGEADESDPKAVARFYAEIERFIETKRQDYLFEGTMEPHEGDDLLLFTKTYRKLILLKAQSGSSAASLDTSLDNIIDGINKFAKDVDDFENIPAPSAKLGNKIIQSQ